MIERFEQFIQKRKLCQKSDKILLAVSGGIDSVVLLDLFVKEGLSAGVVHCNFGLRGKESDHDEIFVKELADKMSLPVFVNRFETKQYAEKQGISIQMAARDLRYAWFEDIRRTKDYDLIATAHNFDDAVETMIFNLTKGTGLKGLTGIPVRTNNIIRPLLFATRDEIESYARDHNLKYRIDSSNKSTKYHRNYIRHRIIPEFEKINPGFLKTTKNTLARLNGLQNVINNWLEFHEVDYFQHKGEDVFLNKDFFLRIGEPALLHEIIKVFGFNYDQTVQIFENLKGRSGKLYYSDTYVLNSDRSHLVISRKEEQEDHFKISENEKSITAKQFKLELEYIDPGKEMIKPSPHIGYLDFDKLKYPLEFRNWEKGDWFIPLGMKGKKKLSDFMIDKKIPLNLKNKIMVLLSGASIAWIAGYRLDDRFKIQDDTKKILKITYLKLDD
jgi:tRNA(Ile)-lysidine synthase